MLKDFFARKCDQQKTVKIVAEDLNFEEDRGC